VRFLFSFYYLSCSLSLSLCPLFVKPFSFVSMADEIPFRSLTIEEQLVYSDRFASCCSNEFLSDLRYIQEEMGVKLDGFDEFYACVFSIRRSFLGSIPFSETLWMNFEKSFLTITNKFNELVDSYEQTDLVSKNMDLESNQDYEMVSVELPSCMSGIDFTKTYDTYEVRVEPPSCMSWCYKVTKDRKNRPMIRQSRKDLPKDKSNRLELEVLRYD
jgi:hypothetical protein